MMKKIIFFSLMLTVATLSNAQSLEDIGKLMEKNQFAAAKTGIEKYLADTKNANSTEAWYYKGRIYNSLSREATVNKADAYAYKLIAFDAFKKNQQLDKLDLRMKSEFYKSYLDIYLGMYDLGAKNFNEKDFKGAYNSFLKAQEVENFIINKNYTYEEIKLNKLDTALVMNMGASALQAGDTSNAVLSYRRITDAGITGTDNERIYEYLASYYLQKNDDVNAQAILTKAKNAYPNSNYWDALELDKISKGGDKKALFARYEEMYISHPKSFENNYNYAVEMYNSLYSSEVKTPDTTLYAKLTAVLKSTIAVDTSIDATVLLNNHLFNVASDYNARASLIKDTKPVKPELVKRKKELNAIVVAKMDEMIPYAEKALKYFSEKTKLTTKQKINYQLTAGYLSDAYMIKGDPKKTAEYDKIRTGIKF